MTQIQLNEMNHRQSVISNIRMMQERVTGSSDSFASLYKKPIQVLEALQDEWVKEYNKAIEREKEINSLIKA